MRVRVEDKYVEDIKTLFTAQLYDVENTIIYQGEENSHGYTYLQLDTHKYIHTQPTRSSRNLNSKKSPLSHPHPHQYPRLQDFSLYQRVEAGVPPRWSG